MLPALFRSTSLPAPPQESTTHEPSGAPFVLERRSLELKTDGTFTPEAAVWLSPALLESGLLSHLSPVELQTLVMVLCGVTSNGTFVATPESLAGALRLWPKQMRTRLERLMARQWNGEPLLTCHTTETGLQLVSPSPALFEVRNHLVFPAQNHADDGQRSVSPLERPAIMQENGARIKGGSRETVVAHSRATYGRPRAEVEAEINRFLGSERNPATIWPGPAKGEQTVEETAPPPEEAAKLDLARRLISVGLSAEQARFFVASFPADLIERQLEYLPYRHARSPVGMLVASIEGDYAPPLSVRFGPSQTAPADKVADDGVGGDEVDGDESPSGEMSVLAEPQSVSEPTAFGTGDNELTKPVDDGAKPSEKPLIGSEAPPFQNDLLADVSSENDLDV